MSRVSRSEIISRTWSQVHREDGRQLSRRRATAGGGRAVNPHFGHLGRRLPSHGCFGHDGQPLIPWETFTLNMAT